MRRSASVAPFEGIEALCKREHVLKCGPTISGLYPHLTELKICVGQKVLKCTISVRLQ